MNNDNTKNKYIATAMNRHYIDEGTFVYSSSHTIIGDINPKTHVFTDMNGNTYGAMLDIDYMLSEIPNAYGNLIEVKDLSLVVPGDLPLEEKLKKFNSLSKDVVYFVGRVDNKTPFYIPMYISQMVDATKKGMEAKKQLEEYKSTPIADKATETTSYEDDYYEDDYYEEGEMNPELDKLVMDVINGVYELQELKEIRKNLKKDNEDIESVIESIDLQIEATETGKAPTLVEEEAQATPAKKEEKTIIEKEEGLIDTEDLFNTVTKSLIAQDEAAHRVIAEIARKEMHSKKKKDGILLTGSTGVGKTYLMNLIAEYLDRPFHKIDSTTLTTAGYTGKDVEECLWDLYIKCGCDKERAERAIIFFDEIDKKGSSKKDDHSGQGVLHVLLPFIEGSTYDACADMKTATKKVKIDTSNMIVFLGGAFNDVYKNLKEKGPVGFNPSGNGLIKERAATVQDFVEKAMMTDEIMGRVAIVRLKDLDVEDIKRVMLESDESAMKIQEEIFAKIGVKITFTDGYTTAIAEIAAKRKTGARGLNTVIDETTWRAFDDVYKKSNRGKYSEVILDEETVKDPSHYQLVKRVNEVKRGVN